MNNYDRSSENFENGGVDPDIRLVTVNMSNLRNGTCEELRAACEAAYRRGYAQGYYAAFVNADDGFQAYQIERHYEKKVYPWRLKKHRGKHELPPVLAKSKQQGWARNGVSE